MAYVSSSTAGLHHNVVVVGGDDMCGYFAALELLRYSGRKGMVRVGYMHEDSPFIGELKREGAKMIRFELKSEDSIKRMFSGMDCAIISPPVFCADFKLAPRVIEMAKRCSDHIKHVTMMSLFRADELRGWDRLCAVHDMEKMMHASVKAWEKGACIVRNNMPLEGFHFLRRIIQQKREMPWPTRDERVAPVSLCEVGKAMLYMMLRHEHGDAFVPSPETDDCGAAASARPLSERLAAIELHQQEQSTSGVRMLNMTGLDLVTGTAMAEKCGHAIGERVQLKAMSSDEFAKCLKQLGELPDEYISVLKQIAEVIAKGMWARKCDDLHKILERKPMSVEKYFEHNRSDFKPRV